ncbi:MAG: Cof-type HAD-IIB family hydrolase [Anaerolineaceae bacterium]|nr:Cof-type HAD-IIB family hydrolase [Anaerolineaceae bacterium]
MDLGKYKLLVSDIDGTALNSKHELFPETVQAFRQLREFGILTTIATGKIFPSVDYLTEQLCENTPFLVGHGSIIQDKDGNILLRHRLSPEVSEIIFETSARHNCDIAVYLPNGILARKFNCNMQYLTEYWEPRAEEVGEWRKLDGRISEIAKVLFVNCDSDAVLDQIASELSVTLKGKAAVQYSIPHVIEVTNCKATKDTGLHFLSEYLGIPKEQIIAIGDGPNDERMLKYVGCGIAMGNASPALKELADLIIGTNDENGLANAIQDWLDESGNG